MDKRMEEIKTRKGRDAKPTQPHRDRTKYRRKEKHRDETQSTPVPG